MEGLVWACLGRHAGPGCEGLTSHALLCQTLLVILCPSLRGGEAAHTVSPELMGRTEPASFAEGNVSQEEE